MIYIYNILNINIYKTPVKRQDISVFQKFPVSLSSHCPPSQPCPREPLTYLINELFSKSFKSHRVFFYYLTSFIQHVSMIAVLKYLLLVCFFWLPSGIAVWTYHNLFSYSSVDRQLGCFQVFFIMNKPVCSFVYKPCLELMSCYEHAFHFSLVI